MARAVHYRLLHKIAQGGMAEIHLALQAGAEGFQKQVVLKRILPALSGDPAFVRMLVDEAHIASTLNHSNLVQVLDLGKSGDEFFLVLEFVDGWSLEQVRRRAQKAKLKLPLPLALYVVAALCRALAYVHTRTQNGRPLGIVHRDVTPQNVLLSKEGEVKLADFGIAKAVDRRERSATGVIKGKFAYMSPEQSIGAELDARSDLFSVGTVLYLLTTGRKPFEGDTDVDVLMKVRKARYEKPSSIVRDFHPEVERFIARALRPDRDKRWQNAEQMADKLDAILAKLGQPAGPAVLKRWLESLSAKDGVKTPAEVVAAAAGTVQLSTRDLDLEDISAPGDTEQDPHGPPTLAERRRSTPPKGSRGSERQKQHPAKENLADNPFSAATRPQPPPAALLDAEAVFAAPTRVGAVARLGRWLRRAAITTVVLAAVVGGGAYFAWPHLPGWVVRPVESWVRGLPVPLGSGAGAPKRPTPDRP